MKPTRYVHPENPRIVYYDLPGVATSEVKKENYINSMKIADYDFIFIFFEYVITEDMLWLVGEFKKLGKPYCLVRSKMDQDIKNGERENVDSEMVIRRIRQKIEKSLEKNKSLKDAKKVFFISCVDTNIGELSELLSYVESNLDDFKGLAALASMAVLSEFIIGLKYKVLKNRIKKVSVAAAAIAAVPVPGVDVALNIALLVEEVIHYINSFGLSRKKMETLDTFDTSRLKCTKILLPGAEMAVFVIARLGFFVTLMVAENLLDLFLPFVGSLISGATSAVITTGFKPQCKIVSVAAAAIAAVPVPGVDVALNIALLVEENQITSVLHTTKLSSTSDNVFEDSVFEVINFINDLPDTPRTREKVRTRFRKRMYNQKEYEKTK
ncbi:T-cell-specific guanine nucleotide triphosphate-binding protein 2-like [Mytilus edulis]|uniref:T-cell-specific guanine nucleotide triphosphate-binding protein 2-like n=1 Tax=Mytilus edulis TaxID=6550 RepID=UPI0039F14DAD